MEAKYVLEMDAICKSFYGVQVLKDVGFKLKPGEIHALIGENGAGKSTLMKILSGIYAADSGIIAMDGNPVRINSPLDARKLGVNIMHQELCMAGNLTAAENIYLGQELTRGKALLDKRAMRESAQEMLDRFGMNLSAEAEVGRLRVAQQQLIEIVRAISFNARIIIMDEPTSSLTSKEISVLFEQIRLLKARGIAVVFISHKLDEIFSICDALTVMRDGKYIATRPVGETTQDEVVSMMVGREISEMYACEPHVGKEIVLEARGLTNHYIKDCSFTLRKGEILGFAGLVGAGRTELARAVFGVDRLSGGQLSLNGSPIVVKSPSDAIRHGIALVPEDRKKQGLILIHSVAYNLTLAVAKSFIRFFRIDRAMERRLVEEYSGKLSIKMSGPEQLCMSLSGGNQQKVAIAKWLATGSSVLILDEPTRGIDVGAKAEIYRLISDLASSGMAVIVISSELPEVINLSSNIAVMYEGHIAAVLDNSQKQVTQEQIMNYATGRNQS